MSNAPEKYTRNNLYSAAEHQQFDLGESWPLVFGNKEEGLGGPYFLVRNADEFSCLEEDQVEDFEIEQRANARRICTLWNAALEAELSTEAIEAGVIQKLVRMAGTIRGLVTDEGLDAEALASLQKMARGAMEVAA
jgi:hypothetical protein